LIQLRKAIYLIIDLPVVVETVEPTSSLTAVIIVLDIVVVDVGATVEIAPVLAATVDATSSRRTFTRAAII